MLALASSALSLPAQQQKLAIAPDNSTAPLPELNLLTHFRAWTCGERMSLQVKWNDPASGAPTTPTGNDYELICEIILDTAASHSS